MIRWPARWFVVAAGAAVTACGLVIGLDDRPGRPEGASDSGNDAPVVEAGGAGPTFCERQDASLLFCDDFDLPGAAFQRWKGFPPAQAYSHGGEAGIDITAFDAALSPPNVALVTANVLQQGARNAAALITNVDAGGAKAVELSFHVIVDELVDRRTDKPVVTPPDAGDGGDGGGNPDWDLVGEVQIASGGIGALVSGEPSAAVFLFTPTSLAIAVVRDQTTKLSLATTDMNYGRFGKASLTSFAGIAWSRVTILLGERTKVAARATALFGAAPDCPNVPAVAIGGSDVTFSTTKCIEARDEFATIGSYPIIVSAGAAMTDLGDVRLKLDDITVRALP